MKTRTRWKRFRIPLFEDKNRSFFCNEIGWFKVIKVQYCREYCKNAIAPNGSNWVLKERVFIKTDTGLRYVVPYMWLVFHSVTEKGNLIWKVIDEIVIENDE